ncbi:MAG: class I SAM-dependent methyltransferase [Chromatiales bacterium]|nr:class I SAM-dependent methyltransferase [Chromatiales bacterium]
MPNEHSSPPQRTITGVAATIRHWRDGVGRPQGYYIPYRYAGDTGTPPAPAWLLERLDLASPRMRDCLEKAARLNGSLRPLARKRDAQINGARYDQTWFTGLDATLAYTFVHSQQPQRIVEVGSGHSTRFLSQALADSTSRGELISIDPQPRREIDTLCSQIHRVPVTHCDVELFASLGAGDILFLDGSHIMMPGTDVDFVFSTVLPVLERGVLIHIHDIFLPDPYPDAWRWRSYNEQQTVCALIGTGRFNIAAASAFIRNYHPDWLENVFAPCTPGAFESSLWLEVS